MERINRTVCNKCGKEMDLWDIKEGFFIHKRVGYGSIHDGEVVNLNLCCSCFDKLISDCAVDPIEGDSCL